jgi:TonB dependent receptor
MQNPALNANNYFRVPAGKPNMRIHRTSASLTGPVYLPKLYDGHNKTFFTLGFEWIYSFDPSPWVVEAVPTLAQRTGDFSSLLAISPQYQIYDPYSTTPAAGGQFSRTPLPNNIIPTSRINPVSAKIASLWDLPNQQGTIDGTNNYTMGKNAQDTYGNELVRIDHNVSEKERFYVRTNFTTLERPENVRQSLTDGDNFYRFNRGVSVDNVYMASTRFFIDTRFTLTRFYTGYTPYQEGWDLASLGFSPTYINQIKQLNPQALKFPNVNVSGYSTLGGVNTDNKQTYNTYELAVNVTNIIGRHTVRSGVAYRTYQENAYDLGNSSGLYNFDSTWTGGPFNNSAPAPIGQGLASFLYGLPASGSFPINDNFAEQTRYWAFYSQDDWRLSRKLTLSLGLRYELPSPLTERYNRSVQGFDAAAASPIVSQVLQNYAQNPIPQVPATQFNALGGLTFAGAGGLSRNLWHTSTKEFMPRIGFAYSMTPKTVLRGGYGIYYEPLGVTNVQVNQTGFSSSTAFVGSLDNGQTYVANLTNPFPGGFIPPLGAAGGASTFLGQTISFFNQNLTNPYMQRWQFAVQRELPGNSVLEVSYVGNRGTRLRATQDLDPIPRQYLSTLPARDQTTINLLNAQVANPFYPLLPRTNLAATTVARSQLLRPDPQFSGITAIMNSGFSWYHGFQLRAERRLSGGLAVGYSFTWSKFMQAINYLNPTDPTPEKVISDLDRPFHSVATVVYELPFGQGKRWGNSGNKVVSLAISGWQVQSIFTEQSGQALGFGDALLLPGQTIANVVLPAGQRSVSEWFNVAAFNRASSQQLASNIQGLSSAFSGVRAPPVNNFDMSAIKTTRIKERLSLQFNAEFVNALNHPQFIAPNTTPTSTAFGQLTGSYNWQRIIEFGLKVLFQEDEKLSDKHPYSDPLVTISESRREGRRSPGGPHHPLADRPRRDCPVEKQNRYARRPEASGGAGEDQECGLHERLRIGDRVPYSRGQQYDFASQRRVHQRKWAVRSAECKRDGDRRESPRAHHAG